MSIGNGSIVIQKPEELNYYQKRQLSYQQLIAYNNEWSRYYASIREQKDSQVLFDTPLFFKNIRELVARKMKPDSGEYDPIRSLGELSGIVKSEYWKGHPSDIPLPWEQLDIVENGYEGHVEALQVIQSEWTKIVEHGEKLLKAKESKLRRDFIKAGGKISIKEALEKSGIEETVKPQEPVVEQPISIKEALDRICSTGQHDEIRNGKKLYGLDASDNWMSFCWNCSKGLHYCSKAEIAKQQGVTA